MDPRIALNCRAQVEAFQQRHHTRLVTMLFSDVVGSTRLKQILGDRRAIDVLQRHHALFRETLRDFEEGEEIGTAGDAFFIVFSKPSDAARFAMLVQHRTRELEQMAGQRVCDRIGIHVGEVWVDADAPPGSKDLYGIQVDTCARVCSLAEADQVLLTRFAFDSARQILRGEDLGGLGPLSWHNHGHYVMKGVDEPMEVCEVGETGKAKLSPPADTEKAHRFLSPDSEPVLGWRPAIDERVPGTSWLLDAKLGEGGFGEVWLGHDKVLKTQHVFKFCFRADRVRSLKREATLFRLLRERIGSHPNIVALEKVYFDEPPYYIVMEYVEGENLAAWCEAQGGIANVPVATRLEIVAQVADALQAAHDCGVIHRDVKPSNILVSGSEGNGVRVRLTDFGIGQVVSDAAFAGITHLGFTQTVSENSPRQGTHLYMAPELLAGKPASIRSDIYALGVVLYQLLVGDLSRPVATDWAKLVADPLLADDLANCFAGDPQARFAGAEQLASQIRSLDRRRTAVTEQRAIVHARERAAYRRGIMRTVAFAGVIVAAVAALAIYAFQKAKQARLATIDAERSLGRAVEEAERATNAQATAEEARKLAAARAVEAQASAESAVQARAVAETARQLAATKAVEAEASAREALRAKEESEKATQRALQSKGEAEKATTQTLRSKSEAEMATKQALQSKTEAEQAAQRAIDSKADAEKATKRAEDLLQTASKIDARRATQLLEDGDWEQALAYLDRALRYSPANLDAAVSLWSTLRHGSGSRGLLPRKVVAEAGVGDFVLSPDGKTVACLGLAFNFDRELGLIRIGKDEPPAAEPRDNLIFSERPDLGPPTVGDSRRPAQFRSVQFSADGKLVGGAVLGGGWMVRNSSVPGDFVASSSEDKVVQGESFSPDLRRVVAFGPKDRLSVSDAITGRTVRMLAEPAGKPVLAAWAPDGRTVAIGFATQDLQFFDASTGHSLAARRHFDLPIQRLQFNRRGNVLLVTLGRGQPERVALAYPRGKGPAIERIESMRDAWWTGHDLDWVGTSEPLTLQFASASGVASLAGKFAALSSDGQFLLTVRLAQDCRLFHLPDIVPCAGPTTLAGSDRWCGVTPDGRTVCTAAHGGGIILWDVPAPERPLVKGNRERVEHGRFPSPDERWEAVVSDVGHLTIEASASKAVVGMLSRRIGIVAGVSWSEDGHTLKLRGLHGEADELPWDPPTKPDKVLHDLVGCVGGSWFTEEGVLHDLPPSERADSRESLLNAHPDDARWASLIQWLLRERFVQ